MDGKFPQKEPERQTLCRTVKDSDGEMTSALYIILLCNCQKKNKIITQLFIIRPTLSFLIQWMISIGSSRKC